MRKAVFTFVGVTLMAASTFAGPHTPGSRLSAAQCDPGANKMVLNVVFQVTGDADSGQAGNYWAMDSYTKHVQAWDLGDGTYCVQVKYSGSFVTVDGTSPGATGHVGAGITGTMEGGYSGVVTGAFSPGTKRTKGSIGSKDYSCVIDPGGSVTGCQYYSWLDYFPGASFAMGFWNWTYDAGDNGTWVNSSEGNSGDIIG